MENLWDKHELIVFENMIGWKLLATIGCDQIL